MRKNISVICKLDKNGIVTPLNIIWENPDETESTFEIDKVIAIDKKASLKGGGMGLRYTLKIKGQVKYIWLDGYFWFVEIN